MENQMQIDAQTQARHAKSAQDFPRLDLEDDEFVIADIKRSVVGLVYVWGGVILTVLLFVAFAQFTFTSTAPPEMKILIGFCAYIGSLGAAAFGYLLCWVYRNSFFIATNQRVVMRIQKAPFSRTVQNVELEHIEDVSFRQEGIWQHIFNYGTVRASTIGDEHTYELSYVSDPATQIRPVVSAVNMADDGGKPKLKKP